MNNKLSQNTQSLQTCVSGSFLVTSEYLDYLFKQQRENCLKEYKTYYAGSKEDFAPDCIIESILNAEKPKVKSLDNNLFYLNFLEWYHHESNMDKGGWSLVLIVKKFLNR
jgi:hypothetical protein